MCVIPTIRECSYISSRIGASCLGCVIRYCGFIIHIIHHWLQQVDICIATWSRFDSHIWRRMLHYYDLYNVVALIIDTIRECFALFDYSPIVDLKTRVDSIGQDN